MAKGALGKGLEAIFEDNIMESDSGVVTLRLSEIKPNHEQPRKYFDEGALLELSESIREHGVLQPIIVRENPLYPSTYEIIAGERRWRAAKIAGLAEIPVIIVDGDDLKVAQIAIVENVQREDLNPVEEAFAYQALIDKFGLTQERLSKEVGKSRSYIANTLRLVNLPDEVLEMLRDGKLSEGHARTLLGLADESQMVLLAQKVVERQMSVREVEAAVKRILAQKDAILAKEDGDETAQRRVYMRDLERRAMDTLGRRVKINQTSKKRTVELAFDNDSDLEELLCLLCGEGFFRA